MILVEIIDKKCSEGDWLINSNNLTRAVRYREVIGYRHGKPAVDHGDQAGSLLKPRVG
jgi:hypothetical protein